MLMLFLAVGSSVVTSCDDEESSSEIKLLSYGPSPALRGGQLKFIGLNLDKVTSVTLPDNIVVSDFVKKESDELIIIVPEATISGPIALNTSKGDIVPKTAFKISEPIAIKSFTESVRPGAKITISGTYLNLINGIMFPENQLVLASGFSSQSATSIEVIVPSAAQSGKIVLLSGEGVNLLQVESANELKVISPKIASFSPATVKPGGSLTIAGTDLDLVTRVVFTGGNTVNAADFSSQSASQIVVNVPATAEEGKLTLMQTSPVQVESVGFMMLVKPSIQSISPNPAKPGTAVTVSGENLDLVTNVWFGGGVSASPNSDGRTATQFTVTVPTTAVYGNVSLSTNSSITVESMNALELAKPTISTFSPSEVWTANGSSITLTGSNLDLVTEVEFPGAGGYVASSFTAEPSSSSSSSLTVEVPEGAVTGNITIHTANGTMVKSVPHLTVVPDVPSISSIPSSTSWGIKMIIQGANLDKDMDIYFPGGILATRFGRKSSTLLEVYVPAEASQGDEVKLAFVTTKNEVLWSPAFELSGITPLSLAVFDDAYQQSYGDWSWGDIISKDYSTEQVYEGTKSWRVEVGAGQASMAFGGGSTIQFAGYESFAIAVYGETGTGGMVLQLKMNDLQTVQAPTVTVVEGVWTEFEIPLGNFASEVGGKMSRLDVVNQSGISGVIYLDKIGFK